MKLEWEMLNLVQLECVSLSMINLVSQKDVSWPRCLRIFDKHKLMLSPPDATWSHR